MLRPTEVKYYVNEEKRTVVCVSDEKNMFRVEDRIQPYAEDKHVMLFNTYIPDRFVGIAKCHPDDEWNEIIGKNVAYDKMSTKFTAAYNAKLREKVRDLRALADIIEAEVVKD